MLQLAIQEWSGWQGALPMQIDASEQPVPDVSAIPPMLRRRLNTLGKMAVARFLEHLPEGGDAPIVYASRHGDIDRTLRVLRDIANDEPMSPMQFSLAVHNAIMGVLSIQQQWHASIHTIAAGDEPLIPTLLEMAALLTEGHERVYAVLCDVTLPEIYQQTQADAQPPFVVCLVASQADGTRIEFAPTNVATASASEHNQTLAFVRYLDGDQAQFTCTHNRAHWAIQKS